MEVIVKVSPKVILKQYIFVCLIFPFMGLLASVIQTTSNPQKFPWHGNLQGMAEISILGLGMFVSMVIITLPTILNEKLIINNNQLIWQNWRKQKKLVAVCDITNIEKGWKAITLTGRIQVLRISSNTSTISIEIKKYLEKDLDNLVYELQKMNPKIISSYKYKKSILGEMTDWFKG